MNILFLNQEEPVMGTVTVQDLHHVKIEGVLQNLSGFHLVTNDGQVYGKYETYTTLYKTVEDGYILSDDGSVYVEPDPEPEPEPYVPTLEEIQEAKVNEMNAAQQAVIAEGVDVVLTRWKYGAFHINGERSDEPCRIAGTSGSRRAEHSVAYFR